MDKHWIPLFSWTSYNDFHYFLEKPASSAVNVHFFVEFKKVFQEQEKEQQQQQEQQQQISRS